MRAVRATASCILTLHGSQFRDATLIVASPPCQFFSYCAMPWSRAKALAAEVRADPVRLEKELALFKACFCIQREACEAAGRHIPLIVENVRGAQAWVGRARWNWGPYYLWGDVPALMAIGTAQKVRGGNDRWFNDGPRTPTSMASFGSRSPQRRAASAMIAKIPAPLARHIAVTFYPGNRKAA